MSTLKTGALRGTSGTADSIQLHASNQSVTFPGDVTCSGTSTGFGGITVADQWHLDDDQGVSSGEYLTDHWLRSADDTTGWGGIGSAMTESSGVFTFPSTGIYRITFYAQGFSSSTEMDWVYARINGTTNNFTSTNTLVEGYSNTGNASGNVYAQITCDTLFDVTDTSNRKVKVWAQANTGTWTLHSSSGASRTHIIFTRLGDT